MAHQVGPTSRPADVGARLIAEAFSLARDGGPEAVVLREVARRSGVSATAAYRYFADHDALRLAVKHRALAALDQAMRRALARVDTAAMGPVDAAQARLRTIGAAYVAWGRRNPGLFRTAFAYGIESAPSSGGEHGRGVPARPVLDEIVTELAVASRFSAERRANAEEAAWSAVHGVTVLLISGPLRTARTTEQDAIVDRVLTMVVTGL